jgi:hypothetical protein
MTNDNNYNGICYKTLAMLLVDQSSAVSMIPLLLLTTMYYYPIIIGH